MTLAINRRRRAFPCLACFHGYTTALHTLERGIAEALGVAAFVSAALPCVVVPIALIIAFGLCGGLAIAFQETLGDRLWVDQSSQPKANFALSQDLFGTGNRVQQINALATDLDSGNLLAGTEFLSEVFELHESIATLATPSGTTMYDLCKRDVHGKCMFFGVLGFWNWDINEYNTWLAASPTAADLGALVSADRYPNGMRVNRAMINAWAPPTSTNGGVAHSNAFKFYYLVRPRSPLPRCPVRASPPRRA
jgi:hypothetical protein